MSTKLKLKLKPRHTVLDLFCGAGGTSEGLVNAGLNVLAGIDIWDTAIETYKMNHSHLSICADLTVLPPETFAKTYGINTTDMVVGTFPCTTYSIAGVRDANDPKNLLFMEFIKYVKYYNPKAFLIENVIGMLSAKLQSDQLVTNIIMEHLSVDYNIIICKLYASDFEVPQNRRRVIIIGMHKRTGVIPTEPPAITSTIDDRPAVKSILLDRSDIPDSCYLSERAISGIIAKKERMKNTGQGFGAQMLNLDKPSYTIPARYWKDGYDALVKYDDTHIRKLTELELMRIQSFPDSYKFAGNRKDRIMQIGNAVACRFAYHLGKHMILLLNSASTS